MADQEFAGFLYNNAGTAISGATVRLYSRNDTATSVANTTTNSSGYWTISHGTQGQFDVEITSGTSVRRIKYDTSVQYTALEVADFRIRNPGNTYKYDIVPAAISADRQLNLPAITGTDTLAVLGLAQTFSANQTFTGTITVGVDDTGKDVKFFGATSGSFLLWDESDDALELTDSSPIKIGDGADMQIYHDGSHSYITNATGTLKLATETSGIAITIGHATSEVTVADNLTVTGTLTLGSGAELTEAELEFLDGITAGTAAASKAIVLDSNKDIGTLRNLTINGVFTDGNYTFDTSGNVSGLGTLASGAITSSGIIKTDNTTEATSTTDGSLQTDGGLSVAKDAVFGDDIFLLSDSAVFNMGAGNDFTITHDGTTGATLAGTPVSINSTGALTLTPTTDVVVANGTGLIVGNTAQVAGPQTSEFQVLGTSVADSSIIIGHWNNGHPRLSFIGSRNATIGQSTIAADNDSIGQIDFTADDGADFTTINAIFRVSVDDSSPAENDIGAAFEWRSLAGGGASMATRMELTAAGALDLQSSSTIVNVGAAGNDWTANALSVSTDNAGNRNSMTLANTDAGNSGTNVRLTLSVGGTSAGDPHIHFNNGAGWNMGMDTSASLFAMSYNDALAANDAFRITQATPPVVSFNTSLGSDFDYVCGNCGRHEAYEFTCCGTVEWHDDVIDFRAMSQRTPDAIDYMKRVGLITHAPNEITGEPETFTAFQMVYFVGSMAYQNRQRMDSQHSALEQRLDKLEALLAGG